MDKYTYNKSTTFHRQVNYSLRYQTYNYTKFEKEWIGLTSESNRFWALFMFQHGLFPCIRQSGRTLNAGHLKVSP